MQTGHAEYQLRCASKDDEKNMKFWLHALTTAVDSVRGEVGASLTVPADNEGQEGAEVDLDEGEGLGAAGGGASADGLAEDDTEARQDRALSRARAGGPERGPTRGAGHKTRNSSFK